MNIKELAKKLEEPWVIEQIIFDCKINNIKPMPKVNMNSIQIIYGENGIRVIGGRAAIMRWKNGMRNRVAHAYAQYIIDHKRYDIIANPSYGLLDRSNYLEKEDLIGISNEKYIILPDQEVTINGHTLHRIKALKDFSIVKKGDLGGYVESEKNLSEKGDCWIYDDSEVCGNAKVYHNAKIRGNSVIRDRARVLGDSVVTDSTISGNAMICSSASIVNSKVYDRACINGAKMWGNIDVGGNAIILESAIIKDNCKIYGDTFIGNGTRIENNVEIYGHTIIGSDINISNYACIGSTRDYLFINSSEGNENSIFAAYKCSDNIIRCTIGYFKGTIEEFKESVNEKYNNKHIDESIYKEYNTIIDLAKCRLS